MVIKVRRFLPVPFLLEEFQGWRPDFLLAK